MHATNRHPISQKVERRASFPKAFGSVCSPDDERSSAQTRRNIGGSGGSSGPEQFRRGVSTPTTRRPLKKRRSKGDDGDLGLGLLRLQSTFR